MRTVTTRPMTKSALGVARQAMAVAREALPPYSAPTSRKTYTQHQLSAVLAVRQFLGTDDWAGSSTCCGRRSARPSIRPGSTGRGSAGTTPPAPAGGWPRGAGRRRVRQRGPPRHPRTKRKVRSTVIALNRRGPRTHPPTTYRKQMLRRFRKPKAKRVSGQRWQVGSGFSRRKRLLRSTARAVKWVNRKKERMPRVIVYNLMLLAA